MDCKAMFIKIQEKIINTALINYIFITDGYKYMGTGNPRYEVDIHFSKDDAVTLKFESSEEMNEFLDKLNYTK